MNHQFPALLGRLRRARLLTLALVGSTEEAQLAAPNGNGHSAHDRARAAALD